MNDVPFIIKLAGLLFMAGMIILAELPLIAALFEMFYKNVR